MYSNGIGFYYCYRSRAVCMPKLHLCRHRWGTASTWTPSGVPGATDHVTIATSHTVTLAANSSITTGNLTVTGTLALSGNNLTAGSLSGAGNIGSNGMATLTVGGQ